MSRHVQYLAVILLPCCGVPRRTDGCYSDLSDAAKGISVFCGGRYARSAARPRIR